MPLFACVTNESIIDDRVRKNGLDFFEKDNPQKLSEFRELVCSKVVEFWVDNKDIQLAIIPYPLRGSWWGGVSVSGCP